MLTTTLTFFFLILFQQCTAGILYNASIPIGISGNYYNWIDKRGFFLQSNSTRFAFGFYTPDPNQSRFFLSVVFQSASLPVWTANPDTPISVTDRFHFADTGDAYLECGSKPVAIWRSNTSGAASMELRDDGNLVITNQMGSVMWQSFDFPSDALLPGQKLKEGMSLSAGTNPKITLRISSGDVVLTAGFRTPQVYWSLQSDPALWTKLANGDGNIDYATLLGNYWNFSDASGNIMKQIVIENHNGPNSSFAAVLSATDGNIGFVNLLGSSSNPVFYVPKNICATPVACRPYLICQDTNSKADCNCPPEISQSGLCSSGTGTATSSCDGTGNADAYMQELRGVGYVSADHATPTFRKSTSSSCLDACTKNCSCVAAMFDNSDDSCFIFDQVGSLVTKDSKPGNGKVFFVKVLSSSRGRRRASSTVIVVVVISGLTLGVISAMIYLSMMSHRRNRRKAEDLDLAEMCSSASDEKDFLDSISGYRPVRYSYKQLHEATEGFTKKLGHGGFGSVYLGKLPDGTRLAVKKLEGVGQGKKEFRAEVSTIGSIHHLHLVRLRGFCAEHSHRLLAYDYMPNGSLDKWIFQAAGDGVGDPTLNWDQRYAVALGTAKGLAYLHGDCEAKIVHCDVKPENVLLDEGFVAKVSDFGLAKLMGREQSNVFTTLRGTRGYLAPEWILSSAISEKSDVYSYGMVLLEIIAGRKSYVEAEENGKEHLPTYAYRVAVEEGRPEEVLDWRLKKEGGGDERVELAVMVALWCLQEDVGVRPGMGRVVQMLEGVVDVSTPPPIGFRAYKTPFKSMTFGESSCWETEEFSGSGRLLSAVRLSGPR